MLHQPKLLPSSSQLLHSPTLPQIQHTPITPSPTITKHNHLKIARRDLALCANSSLLLFLGSQTLQPLKNTKALAEEIPQEAETNTIEEKPENQSSGNTGCTNKVPTKKAFLDISIDGDPAGRIVIGLYGDDAPVGTVRFSNLVSGAAGITYRRKEFIKIMPSYVQHGGVRSYGVDAEIAKSTGSDLTNQSLIQEWERENGKCLGTKNLAGTIGIIVRDPSKPPPKLKLVARNGKLEVDEEEIGNEPNGTEFVMSIKDSPELDASALVVGRILEGMEVVKTIGQVKTVQENTGSPYFRVAKLIGDKRAVVAERGFNRPYSKVLVTNCGLLE
ncbi:peptidyl-prolyl cis-trans isomerase CYP26-2, chloroplastic isoform X2 [Rhodamnia argentea]|uniref:Peptidyl-prolyl cis-trans isomerase CYP26-2, chloroplastic isoform X2 n=1 Tax=Rhodamnia argentea TaxID=178133 RepID=A0A8B8NGQ2_9MYRT|nr:peptidyl-prolyl cis-trans isomerase CYP26-2, chloroplastic isoform X2 [Rhodamnia argentea]